LKNHVSFQNNSEKPRLKTHTNAIKSEAINVTFRNKSIENKPKKNKQKKINKCENEAKKKLKNDNKVAKALGVMSKHFSKLQIGKKGESKYRFLNK
jgi:division protein CdvB (Snf7/Vps24/ESCRT-III family)